MKQTHQKTAQTKSRKSEQQAGNHAEIDVYSRFSSSNLEYVSKEDEQEVLTDLGYYSNISNIFD